MELQGSGAEGEAPVPGDAAQGNQGLSVSLGPRQIFFSLFHSPLIKVSFDKICLKWDLSVLQGLINSEIKCHLNTTTSIKHVNYED